MQPKKILIIEDEANLRKVLVKKFNMANYEVSEAIDGIEAMKKIRSEKPDLVILDLLLPLKDGFQVLQELKKDDSFKDIPVIILSNLGSDFVLMAGKKTGALEYLIKSEVPINEVVKHVDKILND